MILVDTSIWIDHLRNEEPALKAGLERGTVLVHPFVAGELMLGNLHDRRSYVSFLDTIPEAPTASTGFVRDLIEEAGIFGSGIGYVDVHLIASTLILDGGTIWTRDRRLAKVADRLGLLAAEARPR